MNCQFSNFPQNSMDIEQYRNYCLSKKHSTESFPFPNLPNSLVFKVAGKMFTATNVEKFSSISLQLPSDVYDEAKARYSAIKEHTYFKKGHWVIVEIDGSIPVKLLLQWIDDSYELAIKKLTKKERAKLSPRGGG